MLILVAVTLDITLGENGLVNKAKTAGEATTREVDRETLLTAAIGAMGNDGKVNFTELDANLPERFTGSNGTYTSENGYQFTVRENGEIIIATSFEDGDEITNVNFDGIYYLYSDKLAEIKNNNTLILNDEIEYDITIDAENHTIEGTAKGDGDFGPYAEINLTYELYIVNNEVLNILLTFGEDNYEELVGGTMWQNTNGLEQNLNGTYIDEDGTERITFNSQTGKTIQEYYSVGKWYQDSIGSCDYYQLFNGTIVVDCFGIITNISEDLNTFTTYEGETYTKIME